jgi:hypothetical protein
MKFYRMRWSLKLMFVCLTIFCVLAGLRAIRVRSRARAIGRLERANALLFDSDLDYFGPDAWWRTVSSALSLDRSWPHRLLGDWACQTVYCRISVADVNVDDQLIDDIGSMPEPRWITLIGKSAALSSPEKLASLRRVRYLYLGGKWVTREYADALLRSSSVETLVLLGSSLVQDDFREIGQSCPQLDIVEGSDEDLNNYIKMIRELANSSPSQH